MKICKSQNKEFILINGDTYKVLDRLKNKLKVDCILTSPPYNNSRNIKNLKNHEGRYDVYLDQKSNEEYLKWVIDIFNKIDYLLNENGVILWNISYGTENPNVFFEFPYHLIYNTNFMIADVIIWKKNSALPNNVSKNKLTRIVEYVYVICRKDEYNSFNCNKKVKSISKTGQNYYENIFNFIQAPNNDGSNNLNKATYSTELCKQLLNMYCKSGDKVLDIFNGTGTTGNACLELDMKYIGIELSENQYNYSYDRLLKKLGEINNNENL